MDAGIDRRELRLLAAACALSVLVALAYVLLLVADRPLAGDEIDYDAYGTLAADGRWFWSQAPYGIPHPSAWKPPGYPAWMGVWYTLLGEDPTKVEVVQTFLGVPMVLLTWALARRFTDDRRVRLAAAFVVALYPMAWQYLGLLYPEALAIPLSLAVLLVALGGGPTPRRAAVIGALVGVNLLVRPSAFFLLAGVLAGWLVLGGLRRTAFAGVIAVAVAGVVIAPWMIRNADVTGTPMLSVQDIALAGTFNPTSANDPVYPYAWRPLVARDVDLYDPDHPLSEADLRSELTSRAFAYIRDHPASVPKAFFWNGLSRLWDVRRPGRALAEVPFEGRVRGVAIAGLVSYYVLALLAVGGLWRIRRDRALLATLLGTALAASIVFTAVSGTRYRAPLEPVIVVLACVAGVALLDRLRRAPPGHRPARPHDA